MQAKIKKLEIYLSNLQVKLSDPIPQKHTHRPLQYKQFLNNEINTVRKQLDSLKLEAK